VAVKHQDRARTFRAALAASFETEAIERAEEGGLIESAFLTQAMEAYTNLGDKGAVQRIRARLHGANTRAMGEMQTVGGKVVLDMGEIHQSASKMTGAKSADPAAIRTISRELGFWPAWAAVEQERRANTGVFVSLASTTLLEHDGRSVPLPDAGPDREAAATVRAFAQRSVIMAGLAPLSLQVLRDLGTWSEANVSAAIYDLDIDLGRACEPGLAAFEAGQFWTALHVLAPRLERAIRLLGHRLDAPIHRVTSAQRLMWAMLDPMLEDAVIRLALGEDFARELQALFTSEYGLNIRNNVAHGAADIDSVATAR
jgi:hypothetical protein